MNFMTSPRATGFRRLLNALRYSCDGFRACLKEEAFRQEVLLSFIFIPLGAWIGDTGVEKALLVGSVLLVLAAELLNTAIERAIDRISFERHEFSREAKDMGSATVLMILIFAGVVWGFIALPKIF